MIKRMCGVAVEQDPADAAYPSMPRNALEHVDVDYSEPVAHIANLLVDLTRRPAPTAVPVPMPAELDTELRIAKEENPMEAGLEQIAKPSRFACPECHAVLLQLDDNGRSRFRTSKPPSGAQSGAWKRPRCFSTRLPNTRATNITAPACRS